MPKVPKIMEATHFNPGPEPPATRLPDVGLKQFSFVGSVCFIVLFVNQSNQFNELNQ